MGGLSGAMKKLGGGEGGLFGGTGSWAVIHVGRVVMWDGGVVM